jgi:hypothetical protein
MAQFLTESALIWKVAGTRQVEPVFDERLDEADALRLAADHGAVRGGCVEPDRLDVPTVA